MLCTPRTSRASFMRRGSPGPCNSSARAATLTATYATPHSTCRSLRAPRRRAPPPPVTARRAAWSRTDAGTRSIADAQAGHAAATARARTRPPARSSNAQQGRSGTRARALARRSAPLPRVYAQRTAARGTGIAASESGSAPPRERLEGGRPLGDRALATTKPYSATEDHTGFNYPLAERHGPCTRDADAEPAGFPVLRTSGWPPPLLPE